VKRPTDVRLPSLACPHMLDLRRFVPRLGQRAEQPQAVRTARLRPRSGSPPADDLVRWTHERASALVAQFLDDFAGALAGEPRTFDVAQAEVRESIWSFVAPWLATGERLRTDFGDWINVRVSGEPRNHLSEPVQIEVAFTDKSEREDARGARVMHPRRRLVLVLAADCQLSTVLGYRFDVDGGSKQDA